MAKVIPFSRTFPSYHFRKGQPTFFLEKFCNWYYENNDVPSCSMAHLFEELNERNMDEFINSIHADVTATKNHTIRRGKRWKAGDFFSPRIWSGVPYQSKQIILTPDLEVKKVFDFEMDINGAYSVNGKYLDKELYPTLALNDGLTEEELFNWFMPNYNKPKEFIGQIICWNENVNY